MSGTDPESRGTCEARTPEKEQRGLPASRSPRRGTTGGDRVKGRHTYPPDQRYIADGPAISLR
eukprot:8030714-Pyramimonas_sp.AAC.1